MNSRNISDNTFFFLILSIYILKITCEVCSGQNFLSPSFTRSLTPVKGLSSVLKGPTEGPWMLALPCTEAPKAGGLGVGV